MKNKVVIVPAVNPPIKRSPGFEKKKLSQYKLDIIGLCGFGCHYCSSNWGNYLRIRREEFADLTEQQLGERIYPDEDPSLTFEWSDIIEKLEEQLEGKDPSWGKGDTLVFSMLTDGFSPNLVKNGITKQVLELVLIKTSFRIRVLTKSAIVGKKEWVDYFSEWPGRITVGLSIGSINDEWCKNLEEGTSTPTARIKAYKSLQEKGIPTFGMLCPVFPETMKNGELESLIDSINITECEEIFVEPYNDRNNWESVANTFDINSDMYKWMIDVFEKNNDVEWSRYATELYNRVRKKAEAEDWVDRIRFLLYENRIQENDIARLKFDGTILFQNKPEEDGFSKHSKIALIQKKHIDDQLVNCLELAQTELLSALGHARIAWIFMGTKLINLKQLIEDYSERYGVNKKLLWERHFNTDSYTNYCETVLKMDKRTCDEIIRATKYIQKNNKLLYDAIIQQGEMSAQLSSYSTIAYLDSANVQKRLKNDTLLKKTVNKEVFHNKATKTEVDDLIGLKDEKTSTVRTYRKINDEKDVNSFISSFRSRFMELPSEENYSNEFNTEFEKIISSLEKLLLQEINKSGEND